MSDENEMFPPDLFLMIAWMDDNPGKDGHDYVRYRIVARQILDAVEGEPTSP